MKRLLIIPLLLLAVVACGSTRVVQTARAAVAASAAVYGASVDAFRVYNGLPRCKVAPTPPCSDPQTALDIAQKLQFTRAAIDRARDVVNMLPGQGASTPVDTLTAPQLKILDEAAFYASETETTIKNAPQLKILDEAAGSAADAETTIKNAKRGG